MRVVMSPGKGLWEMESWVNGGMPTGGAHGHSSG